MGELVLERPLQSQTIKRWRRFKRNKTAVMGGIILAVLYILALFAEFVTPYDPTQETKYMYVPPQRIHFIRDGRLTRPFVYGLKQSRDPRTLRKIWGPDTSKVYHLRFFVQGKQEYRLLGLFPTKLRIIGVESENILFLLGTDQFGQDLLSRIVAGARISLLLPLVGMLISSILGAIIGIVSGYFGGVVDHILQRIVEAIASFPRLPLWIALAAALPPEIPPLQVFFMIVVVLSAIGWAHLARQIRGKVLSIREEDYVKAAQSVGTSTPRILFKHILPNTLTHIIVVATLSIPSFILAESSLSFLGIGITPPLISWGVLLKDAQAIRVIVQQPWLLLPGVLITVAMLAFSFVGDGLRDAYDPHLQ